MRVTSVLMVAALAGCRPDTTRPSFLPLPEDFVLPKGVVAAAIALSACAIYCLTLACGWYPSRLASRMPPAEALRYE